MLISKNLPDSAIVLVDRVDGRPAVVETLAARLAEPLRMPAGTITAAVNAREAARSTALPNGAAIPHCRLAGLKTFGIGLMAIRRPIPWDSDGHPVDTVMMIAGPVDRVSDHLRILANASQLLDSPSIRQKIGRAPDAGSVLALVSAAEQAIELRRQAEGALREVRRDEPRVDSLEEIAARFDW